MIGEIPNELRAHLALALDVDDLVAATRLARDLQPWFSTVKVGLELFSAAGPEAITTLRELGFDVFCDLKLHDIPTTVRRAAQVLGALGARYVTMHAAGGAPMLRAGVAGLREGAAGAELAEPLGLAVTVLTSEDDVSARTLRQRVAAGIEGGCAGVVCAVSDVAAVREIAPAAFVVTAGIRPQGSPPDDQARVGSPADALAEGANLLVIGRAVTGSADPAAAARALVAPLCSNYTA